MQHSDEGQTPPGDRIRLALKRMFHAIAKHQLPLQDETTYFILVNMLDFFLTYMLLQLGAIEANPIANYFFHLWGFRGLLVLKLASVVFICLLAQIIARSSLAKARFVMILGTIIVGGVVAYSALLAYRILG